MSEKFVPRSIKKVFEWPKHVNRRFVTPLFQTDVYFVTEREDFAQIDRYMKQRELTPEEDFEGAGGLCADYQTTSGLLQVICVFDGYGLDILCHEVGHAALNILENAGHMTDSTCSEPMCYLQQWLFAQGEDQIMAASLKVEAERRAANAEPEEFFAPAPAIDGKGSVKGKRSKSARRVGGGRGRH